MREYKALRGTIIIRANVQENVSKTDSGLFIVKKEDRETIEVADVISVGEDITDIKVGDKILFPTSTGLRIDKNIFYLKYEDICAKIEE